MKISARSEYACRALLELAKHYSKQDVVQLREIASAQSIPEKYLVHILLQLKKHGLVGSVRGASGGYYMRVAPDEITLGKLIRVIEGPILSVTSATDEGEGDTAFRESSDLKVVWDEISESIAKIIDGITFSDMLDKVKTRSKDVYQI